MRNKFTILCVAMFSVGSSFAQPVAKTELKEQFRNPQSEFRAFYPFHGAAHQEAGIIRTDLDHFYNKYGYGGVMIAPTTDKPYIAKKITEPGYMKHVGNGLQTTLPAGASPWLMTLPKGLSSYKHQAPEGSADLINPVPLNPYLSIEYFDKLREILAYSKETGRKVILYDEIGYPSGISNYTTPEKYYRQLLEKEEEIVNGPFSLKKAIPEQGTLMAVVAMNAVSGKRIDLTQKVRNSVLTWKAPNGKWRLMTFNCVTAKASGSELDYLRLMEFYVHGISRLMGSGLLKPDLQGGTNSVDEWVGRCSMILQSGKRVSEIAIFYPIADLEAFYRFDAPEYKKEMSLGTIVPYDNDFMVVGEMLLGELRCDFTFVHPDFLLSDKI